MLLLDLAFEIQVVLVGYPTQIPAMGIQYRANGAKVTDFTSDSVH